MASEAKLEVVPIGRIVQGIARPNGPRPRVRTLEAQQAVIEIDPDWASALNGIEGFSHIWVLWWLDQAPSGENLDALEVRPEGHEEMPLRGIFATRSPHRPNPIALTPVRLLERRGTRLHVQGLDAFEGTPILDLKPYLRRGDLIPEATTPAWLEQLWQLHDSES